MPTSTQMRKLAPLTAMQARYRRSDDQRAASRPSTRRPATDDIPMRPTSHPAEPLMASVSR